MQENNETTSPVQWPGQPA